MTNEADYDILDRRSLLSTPMPEPRVPNFTVYLNPTLQALKALGGSASIEELNARVAADMKLPEDVLAIPHDPEHGGQSEVAYRVAWARHYLKVAGLITKSERGVWSLTPEGMQVESVEENRLPSNLSMLLQELARGAGGDLHLARQQRLQPGDIVGRFEIVREIGRGGFGVVYEARDRELGRTVAFKLVRPGSKPEVREERLLREAEAAARLSHPNIVTLFDVGRCEQGPYLALEMLRGQTLGERLAGGPLPLREALRIGIEVAKGLAHAHAQGVVHRDLTPGNVFLCEDGQVKVLDLGMAHAFGRRKLAGGTPQCMAPEQLRGEPVDARADVFALGATLFEALIGKAPFEVKEGRSEVLDLGPSPVLPKGTAAPLARLLDRCLSRDPAKRPASGQVVVEELLAVQRALG